MKTAAAKSICRSKAASGGLIGSLSQKLQRTQTAVPKNAIEEKRLAGRRGPFVRTIIPKLRNMTAIMAEIKRSIKFFALPLSEHSGFPVSPAGTVNTIKYRNISVETILMK